MFCIFQCRISSTISDTGITNKMNESEMYKQNTLNRLIHVSQQRLHFTQYGSFGSRSSVFAGSDWTFDGCGLCAFSATNDVLHRLQFNAPTLSYLRQKLHRTKFVCNLCIGRLVVNVWRIHRSVF
eukprot:171286_1